MLTDAPALLFLQASFEPLGLTIAVAKDRAIESLMQVRHSSMGWPMRGHGTATPLLNISKNCLR